MLIGVIYADNRIRSGIFTEADRDLLTAFANQAAVALENARLFASLRRTLAEVTELKNLMDNVFASIASGVITADIRRPDHALQPRSRSHPRADTARELIGRTLEEVLPARRRRRSRPSLDADPTRPTSRSWVWSSATAFRTARHCGLAPEPLTAQGCRSAAPRAWPSCSTI